MSRAAQFLILWVIYCTLAFGFFVLDGPFWAVYVRAAGFAAVCLIPIALSAAYYWLRESHRNDKNATSPQPPRTPSADVRSGPSRPDQ